MEEKDRAWIRSWPLLLITVVLFLFAAWAFASDKNSTASIASFCAALICLGAWITTAAVEWHHLLHKKRSYYESENEDEQ
jgi:thiol:disulfide interchange protein